MSTLQERIDTFIDQVAKNDPECWSFSVYGSDNGDCISAEEGKKTRFDMPRFIEGLKHNTHLSEFIIDSFANDKDWKKISDAIIQSGNKNIVFVDYKTAPTAELQEYCTANSKALQKLRKKISDDPRSLTEKELAELPKYWTALFMRTNNRTQFLENMKVVIEWARAQHIELPEPPYGKEHFTPPLVQIYSPLYDGKELQDFKAELLAADNVYRR